MQVVVKLSVYEGEVMHNICRGGLGGRIFCRVCQFVPFVCGALEPRCVVGSDYA